MAMNPRLLRPISSTLDADAAVYLNAVAQADGQQLEPAVRKAINDFIVGCKRDGIWSAIKASCILAGARTLAGALVPLVGTAPTNVNFVSGDYNRETGLVGNEVDKYLNTNRASNADPQNDFHAAAWVSTASGVATGSAYLGAGGFNIAGSINVGVDSSGTFVRARTSSINLGLGPPADVGLIGVSRDDGATFTWISGASSNTVSQASQSPLSINTYIFARNVNNSPQFYTDGRIAFYSIGESLDLALLDSRVSALITAIGAATP